MPSNQSTIIQKTKFTYWPLGEVFQKQVKLIKDQGKNK